MTLNFPRDMVAELSLGGYWQDVSHRVRQTDPVVCTWGSNAEQGRIPPTTLECVLENGAAPSAPSGYQDAGLFTPGNAMSPYFTFMHGRNTPIRWSQRVMKDTATRTVSNGWGTADSGDVWTNTNGPASDYAVASGTANHVVPTAGTHRLSHIGIDYMDCAVTGTCRLDVGVTSGGPIELLNLILRYQRSGPQAGEYYMLRLELIQPGGELYVKIMHSSGTTISDEVILPLVFWPATSPKILGAWFQIEGQTLRASVWNHDYAAHWGGGGGPWNPASPMPSAWTVETYSRLIDLPGAPGVRSGLHSTSAMAPLTFKYDNMEVRLVRFSGEVTKLAPTWDESHRIKTATVKASGITQRLGRPERPPLDTAARRYFSNTPNPLQGITITDAWLLDEPDGSPSQGENLIPGGAPARFVRYTGTSPPQGSVDWGVSGGLPSAPLCTSLSNDGSLLLTVNIEPFFTVSPQCWSVMFAIKFSPDCGSVTTFKTGVPSQPITFTVNKDNTYTVSFVGTGHTSGGVFKNGVSGAGTKNVWHTVGISVWTSGSDIKYHLNLDTEALGTGTVVGASWSALTEIQLYGPGSAVTSNAGDTSFSNVIVTPQNWFDLTTTGTGLLSINGNFASNVILGYDTEQALTRAIRLCSEEGIPFDYINVGMSTRVMGPQRPIPVLDQLQECAAADGAELYEPRFTAGLAYRARYAMGNQSPRATLDYAAGVVAPPFLPSADDRPTANLVRAERTGGGFRVVEQTTGLMNTRDPGGTYYYGTSDDLQAIGKVPADIKVNVQADVQLTDVAGWIKNLGTNPEIRFPRFTVNMRAGQVTDVVAAQVLGLGLGDRLLIQNLGSADIYRELDQIVRGGVETWNHVRSHTLAFNTAPYEKYRGGVFGNTAHRFSCPTAYTLTQSLTTTFTGTRTFAAANGVSAWTQDTGQYPMTVVIGGELVTISGVTGADPTVHTMTITARSINGVVKAHPVGTEVSVYQPVYYA